LLSLGEKHCTDVFIQQAPNGWSGRECLLVPR
jgi:hypothetical protein